MLASTLAAATAVLASSCGEPPAIAVPTPPAPQHAAARSAASTTARPGGPFASAATPTASPSAAQQPNAERFAGTQFPPPNFEPPSSLSAKPGDGHWTRMGNAGADERAAAAPAVLYKTVVHPHKVSRFMAVTLVAIDLRHATIHLAAGTDDPGVDGLATPAGLVPAAHQGQLLAAFNGGFKPRHGQWGMMVGGVTLVPPRPEGCTIALGRSGSSGRSGNSDGSGDMRIGSWTALQGDAPQLTAYRQTPPCLLDGGELHPHLAKGSERAWGGRDPNRKTRRRSAIGIDASGRVALYALGSEAGPHMLALGMKQAGAVAAAQLDINWSWTRFVLYGHPTPSAELQVTSTLVPKMVHSRTGYVKRAGHRDFFYIKRRQ